MITLKERVPLIVNDSEPFKWEIEGLGQFATLTRGDEVKLCGYCRKITNRGWTIELFGCYFGDPVTVTLRRGYWVEE